MCVCLKLIACFIVQAVRQKMVGQKYVWMILGDYTTNWWQAKDTSITCTPSQLLRASQGYIGTDVLPLTTTHKINVAQMVNKFTFICYIMSTVLLIVIA